MVRAFPGGTLPEVSTVDRAHAETLAAIARFQEGVLTAPDHAIALQARRGWRALSDELDLVGLEFRPIEGDALTTTHPRRLDEGWLARRAPHVPATLPPGSGARWGHEWCMTALVTPAGRLVAVGSLASVPNPDCLQLLACAGAAATVRWREAIDARRNRGLAALGARAGGRLHDLRNQLTLALFHADRSEDPAAREALVGDLRRARELAADGLVTAHDAAEEEARPMGRVALRALLIEEARTLAAAARANGARVRARCPEGLEGLAEPTVLGRLVRNLLLNAAESRSGGASVKLDAKRTAVDRVEIVVEDDGRGMDRVALAGYLDAGRTEGGTGFGTASVAEALERLGASIAVTSAPDCGTRVALELCAPPPPGTRVALVVDPVPRGGRRDELPNELAEDFDVASVRVRTPLQALAVLGALEPVRVDVYRSALGHGRRRLRGAAARAGIEVRELSAR